MNADVLQMAADTIGGAYYILPSSVDEVIILPKCIDRGLSELEGGVQEANEGVPFEKILSSHVYEYNKEKRGLFFGIAV